MDAVMRRITFACRRLRRQWGAELIEFAIVLPLLLLVFAGIVDFALMFMRYLVLSNAAREGARMAVLADSYSATDIEARVTAYVRQGTGDTTLTPTVNSCLTNIASVTPAIPAARVTVFTNYQFPILGPVVGLVTGGSFSSITLGAGSTMRVEATSSLGTCP
jgi:Flp pilus assembly protein TadG